MKQESTVDLQAHVLNIQEPPISEIADEGIRRLAQSILLSALRDLKKRIFDAPDNSAAWCEFNRKWFDYKDKTPFSFLWCCEMAGICPETVQKKIMFNKNEHL